MFSCELARGPLGSPLLPRHFSSNLQNFITHRRQGEQAANVTLSLPKASPASPRPHPDPAPAPPVFSLTLVNGSLNYSCHLRGFLLLQTLRSTGRAGLRALPWKRQPWDQCSNRSEKSRGGFFISIHPDAFPFSFCLIPQRAKPKAKDDDAVASL